MAKAGTYILLALVAIVAFPVLTSSATYIPALREFLPLVEGFSARPVWDFRQWSWGYGTAAGFDPNVRPPGEITRERAMRDALATVADNYRQAAPMITRRLNGHQWAAFMSLLYNLGPGRAGTFAPYINSYDDTGLFSKMRAYVYAGGVRNQGLVNRREKEIALWRGDEFSGRFAYQEPVFEDRILPEFITDENGH